MIKAYALNLAKKLAGDKSGATAIEYGLIAAGIAAVIVGILAVLGPGMLAAFANLVAQMGG